MSKYVEMAGRANKTANMRNVRGCQTSAFHPLTENRYPAGDRDHVKSFTSRQLRQHLMVVEKNRDRRHQQYRQRYASGHYNEHTELYESPDRIRPVQNMMKDKVSTDDRQKAGRGQVSHSQNTWISFFHWKSAQKSVEPNFTDQTLWAELPEVAEATKDSHVLQAFSHQQQIPQAGNLTVPSTCRLSRLASITNGDQSNTTQKRKQAPQRPPILLPKIYTVTPRPLQYRDFLTRTQISGPITDDEWEELKQCRYIRHAVFGSPQRGHR